MPTETVSVHVEPLKGLRIHQKSLDITGIKPDHPFRFAEPEDKALQQIFEAINSNKKVAGCKRGMLIGHNAHFDLSFVQAAMRRCKIAQSPFHHFTVFDTATIGGLVFGKTILAKVLKEANIQFNKDEAHSALYDTLKTAELFCQAVNRVAK